MDCNNLTQDEFKKHTFQFIHVLRQNGIYTKKYMTNEKTKPRPLPSIDDVGSPDDILKVFQEDARNLLDILNNYRTYKYDMRSYFGVDKSVTYADIIDDWKLFFGIVGIRFLTGQARISEQDTAKVIKDYLNKANE